MNGEVLGLTVSLPTGTSHELKEKRESVLRNAGGRKVKIKSSDADGNLQGQDQHDSNSEAIGEHEESMEAAMDDDGLIDEEDRVIMPFVGEVDHEDDIHGSDVNGTENENESDQDDDNDTDLEDLSITPPPTMPVLSLDLERLCGYQPTSQQECDQIVIEIQEALLGPVPLQRERQDGNGNGNGHGNGKDREEEDDETYLEFITKSNELFEAGVAIHATKIHNYHSSPTNHNDNEAASFEDIEASVIPPRATISYPEFLPVPQSQQASTSTLLSTKTIWKQIIHPHKIQIVNHLLTLLSQCNRNLIWKYQMMHEIRRIATYQYKKRQQEQREAMLRVWRKEKRPQELAKLYDVRETFVIRLDTSRRKLKAFEDDREVRVQRELRRRVELASVNGVNGSGTKACYTGGIAGLDWDTNVTFGFGEDVEEVVQKLLEERLQQADGSANHGASNRVGEDEYNEYNSSSFAEDEFDDVHENGNYSSDFSKDDHFDSDAAGGKDSRIIQNVPHAPSTFPQSPHPNLQLQPSPDHAEMTMPLPVTSMKERKKRRAAAAAKRLRKKLQSEQEKSLEHELRVKIERAYAEEQAVRQMFMSTDEKLAMSTVIHLEKQLEKVDELLETLQEEEWKDEEEGLLEDNDDDGEEDWKDDDDDAENGDGSGNGADDSGGANSETSVLHQILAMILGAITYDGKNGTQQDHFSRLKKEHTTIIEGWKEEFGRLPQLNDNLDSDEDNEEEGSEDSLSQRQEDEVDESSNLNADANVDAMRNAWDVEEEYVGAKIKDMSLLSGAASKLGPGPSTKSNISTSFSTSMFGPSSVPDDWEDAADDEAFDEMFRSPPTLAPGIQQTDEPKEEENSFIKPVAPAPARRIGLRLGGRIK